MKFLSIVLLSLSAVSAFADETPILETMTNNGSVGPQYRHSYQCTIFADHVEKVQTVGFQTQSEQTKVNYGSSVPDANALRNLVFTASETATTVMQSIPPIGGGIMRTVAYQDSCGMGIQAFILVETSGQVLLQRNESEAAQQLLQFVSYNCDYRPMGSVPTSIPPRR